MAKESGLADPDLGASLIDCGRAEDSIKKFAELVAAKEREACAKVADVHALGWQKNPGANPEAGFIASSNCAAAIRARSIQ